VSGVFAEEATVLGTVFADLDGERRARSVRARRSRAVRIWLDDGSFTVTDTKGLYGFYGISPRTHALRVDATTLPLGSRARATDARETRSAGTRFADVGKGELFRADWAVPGDTALARCACARAAPAGACRPPSSSARSRSAARRSRRATRSRRAQALPATAITTGESRLPLFAPGAGEPAAGRAARQRADARTRSPG
jgi:hypothetical protein